MGTELKALRFVGVAILFLAATLIPQRAYGVDKGQDLPNQKCQRNNTDESTTTGQCASVCKDLEVSTTKDVDSGLRTCQQKATRTSQWVLVAVTGNSSILFLRYNNKGEVQACAMPKENEIECRHINIREAKTKSE
jgi:hypothetical protein